MSFLVIHPPTKHRSPRWPAPRAHFHAINAALSLAAGGGSEKTHPLVGLKPTEKQQRRRGAARRGGSPNLHVCSAIQQATFTPPDSEPRLEIKPSTGVRVNAVPERETRTSVKTQQSNKKDDA